MKFLSWVGCVGFNGPLRQYFSLYRAVSQREGERGEKQGSIAHSILLSPTHRPDTTEILLKRT